jgi:hypothetical protein
VHVHSRKKIFKELELQLQNGHRYRKQRRIYATPAARFNEKGCLQVWGEDAPSFLILMWWKHGLKFCANSFTSMCSVLALPPPHCFYFFGVLMIRYDQNMGLKSIHKFDALFKDSYSSSKGRVYCADIIRRNGTQVSHMRSFPLASLFSLSKNFLPCAEYRFACAIRVYFVCRGIPLHMVQNNSFSFTFHSIWFKAIHSLLPSSELFSKNNFLKRKMKNFFKSSVYLFIS